MTPKPYDILLVDDEPEVTACLSEVISSERFVCTSAHSSGEAVDLLRRRSFDLVLADMLMPGMDGLELLQEARQIRPDSRGILMSGRLTDGMAKSALRRGVFDVIAKPFDFERLRAVIAEACHRPAATRESAPRERVLHQAHDRSCVARCAREVEQLHAHRACFAGLVGALSASLQAKNPATKRHGENTAYYARAVGRRLGLDSNDLALLTAASLVHDIGKIGIPDAVLEKPGKLTVEEFALVRGHPQTGHDILRHVSCLAPLLPAVLLHHEWYDGAGYPFGLRGQEIPLPARIIHLADAVDAMFSRRAYRRCYSRGRVIQELEAGLDSQFDPGVGRAALDLLRSRPELVLTAHNRQRLLAEAGP